MTTWRRILARALLPGARCVLCEAAAMADNLCAACLRELPVRGAACARCALPLARGAPRCGACVMRTPAWDNAASAFDYVFPVTTLVHGVKFRGRLDMALALGSTAAARLCPAPVAADALIPVPLHWRRHWDRGFNQARELAAPVARRCGLPLLTGVLRRRRPTARQTALDADAREANPCGAFAVDGDLSGAHVLLFDDVLTTGATLGAATQALRAGGAASVRVWTCARAHLGIKKSRRMAGFFVP